MHPTSAKCKFQFHPSIGSHQDPVQSCQDPATKRAPRLGETHILFPSVDRIPPGSCPILSGSRHETCIPPRRNAHSTSIRRSDPTEIPSNPVGVLPRNVHPAPAKRTFYFHPSIGSHQDPVQSCQDPATKRAPRLGETHILFPSVDRIPPRSCSILSGSCHETCTLPRRNANFISICRSDPTKIPSNPVRILPRNVHPASAKRTFYFHLSIGSHQDPVQSRQVPATKRAPCLGETQILFPSVDRIPPGSRPILSGSCHETCASAKRTFYFHPSIGSHQDPVQSRHGPATKRAPRLGETQILLLSVDRIPPGSRPIPSGSCHETCTPPRRNANFIVARRRRSRRILHTIPSFL